MFIRLGVFIRINTVRGVDTKVKVNLARSLVAIKVECCLRPTIP